MIINPIIPVYVMAVIAILLLIPMRKGIFNYISQFMIVLLLFVINLRPMVPNGETTSMTRDYKVLFVVDNTISMFAEDMGDNATRMSKVKEDVKYIMDKLPGASFSAVKFDNEVRQMVPFSTDANLTLQSITTLLGQSTIYASGSNLNIIRDPLVDILKKNDKDCVILFLITDGENTKDEEMLSFSQLSRYIDGGAVLGYGTREGGMMKALSYLADDMNPQQYLTYMDDDYEERIAVSRIDEDNLKTLARDLGIEYVHMTKTKDVDTTLNDVNKVIKDIMLKPEDKKLGYSDIYYFFAMLLCLVLVADYIFYRRKVFNK